MMIQMLSFLAVLLGTANCQMSAADIKLTLDTHNLARQRVDPPATNMMDMVWNDTLAEYAQSWADKCTHEHSRGWPYSTFSENLYWLQAPHINYKTAVEFHEIEKENYNYFTGDCLPGEQCTHYTAMVWHNTNQLGCAMTICNTSRSGKVQDTNYFVCEYYPGGNYQNTAPYTTTATAPPPATTTAEMAATKAETAATATTMSNNETTTSNGQMILPSILVPCVAFFHQISRYYFL